jgi:processive 1,2-diacylglycerol beta-glucosyltransferase
MKTVIACTSAGAGHLKAAEAIFNYFQSRDPDQELVLVDVLEESHFIFGSFYSRSYSFMVNHCQWLWRVIFHITSQKNLQPALTKVRTFHNRLNTQNFRLYLSQTNPDVIISTHYLASNIASSLKKKNKISSKLITVITDFGVHPFWVYEGTDLYAVASQASKKELSKLGIPENKIVVSGIPVDPKFYAEADKKGLRGKFGLEPGKFTVLLVTGSFGIGPIEAIVDLLHGKVELLAVCAKNEKLFKRLSAKNYPGVRVFGFVDNIEELMAVSDLIVTKPGGLSIAELLAMELVPIFIAAIPGQEAKNIQILSEYGIGERAQNAQRAQQIVLDYLNCPEKLKIARERISQMRMPRAAEEIFRALR